MFLSRFPDLYYSGFVSNPVVMDIVTRTLLIGILWKGNTLFTVTFSLKYPCYASVASGPGPFEPLANCRGMPTSTLFEFRQHFLAESVYLSMSPSPGG